jgi:hypothetical protein
MAGGIRALKNKNWLNCKQVGTPTDATTWWYDSTGQDDLGHAIFVDPVCGIRVGVHLLAKYQIDDNLKTILDMISKWADKASGNDPDNYARFVGERLHILPTAPLSLFNADKKCTAPVTLSSMLSAMIEMEICEGFEVEIELMKRGIALDHYYRTKS